MEDEERTEEYLDKLEWHSYCDMMTDQIVRMKRIYRLISVSAEFNELSDLWNKAEKAMRHDDERVELAQLREEERREDLEELNKEKVEQMEKEDYYVHLYNSRGR